MGVGGQQRGSRRGRGSGRPCGASTFIMEVAARKRPAGGGVGHRCRRLEGQAADVGAGRSGGRNARC